jgi:hypothetical protein
VIRQQLFGLSASGALAVLAAMNAVAAAAPVPAAQAAGAYDRQQIAELVGRLGDRSFRVREAATRTLMSVGVPAKAELLRALSSPDAEVRYRARLILLQVLELDWKQRLDAFIEDVRGAHDHDLPGWSRFRELVGETPAARRLFADMSRSEPVLLEATELGSVRAGTAFDSRCQQIQESLRVPGRVSERQVSLGTAAALLFVGSDNNVPISMQSAMYVTNFCYQQPFRQAIAGGDSMGLLKKLVGSWVQRDFGNDSSATYQTMMLALQFNVREGIEPAFLMLKDGGGTPHMRQYAVLGVGKFGTAEDIARLEPLLDDRAVCSQQPAPAPAGVKGATDKAAPVVETQIRDVALAVMIHLAGEKLADFGFSRAQPNPTILFNPQFLGFTSNDEREAALARWREWRKSHEPIRK